MIRQQMVRKFTEYLSFEILSLNCEPFDVACVFTIINHYQIFFQEHQWKCFSLLNMWNTWQMRIVTKTEFDQSLYINTIECDNGFALKQTHWKCFQSTWCSEEKNIPTIRNLCVFFFILNFYNPYVEQKMWKFVCTWIWIINSWLKHFFSNDISIEEQWRSNAQNDLRIHLALHSLLFIVFTPQFQNSFLYYHWVVLSPWLLLVPRVSFHIRAAKFTIEKQNFEFHRDLFAKTFMCEKRLRLAYSESVERFVGRNDEITFWIKLQLSVMKSIRLYDGPEYHAHRTYKMLI